MTNQGLQQLSFRAIHGGDGGSYNADMLAACASELEAAELDVPGDINSRLLAWLQLRLDSTETNLNSLMTAFAIQNGAPNWSSMGLFGFPKPLAVGANISIGSGASDPVVSAYTCVKGGPNPGLLLPFATKQNSGSLTVTYNDVAGTQLAFNRFTDPSPDFVSAIYGWFGANVPQDGEAHPFSVDTAGATTFWGKPIQFTNVAAADELQSGAHAASADAFSVAFSGVLPTSLLVAAFIGVGAGSTPADTEQEFADFNATNHFWAAYKRPVLDHQGGSVTMGLTHASGNGNLVACELPWATN